MDQRYQTKVYDEDIIKGNSAIFKCGIPAYINDFVDVQSWFYGVDEQITLNNNNYGNLKKLKASNSRTDRVVVD